jgi:hypothetical protein
MVCVHCDWACLVGEAGGPGIRSLAHARRRLLWVRLLGFVNWSDGVRNLWQRRMGPTPGHSIHQPGWRVWLLSSGHFFFILGYSAFLANPTV